MSVLSMIAVTQDSIKTEGINNPGFDALKKKISQQRFHAINCFELIS